MGSTEPTGRGDGRTWPSERLLARLYDWEHDDLRADTELYVQLARRSGGPVLELACGSGRVLGPLLEAGYRVTGVDRSSAMLDRARARLGPLREAARLVQAELERDLDAHLPDEPFGLVVLALDALGLVPEPARQLALLRAVRRRLADDGLVVFDLVHVAPLFEEPQGLPVLQKMGPDRESGADVIKWMVRRIRPSLQEIELLSIYDLAWADGGARRLTEALRLRYFSRFEIELLLARAGLEAEAIYGDYDLAPFGDESPRLIVLARGAAVPL